MRSLAERALRVIAFAALLGWIALARRPSARVDVIDADVLRDALPRWAMRAVDSVHVRLDTVPDERGLAWLAALRGAGVGVSWSSRAPVPLGVETFPAAEPAGGAVVLVAAASGVVSDALGAIDTLHAVAPQSDSRPTTVRVADVQGAVTLTSGSQPAHAAVVEASTPRRVLVAGAAGWETKFVIAALEEAGWQVDAHLIVGPGNDVWQGTRQAPDTARHAAVVLVDSAGAAVVGGVERFVRQGGGLVIAGDANRSARLAPLVAWRPAPLEVAPLGTLPADTLWRGLSRRIMRDVAEDRAVVIEARPGGAAVVARRYYNGRVAAIGYEDTWRWRMAGDASSMAEHREWWTRLVASVALRAPANADGPPSGAAPMARLHAMLGPAASTTATPPRIPPGMLGNLLGAVAMLSLLAEWLMRRMRGVR